MEPSFETLCARISSLLAACPERPVFVALDGRCGSGKTTLAAMLARHFPESVTLHTDDYYLPPERRASGWEHTPCANMDLLRLRAEALEPLRACCAGQYRAYCCGAGTYKAGGPLVPKPLVLVEGSYSTHPSLTELYDFMVLVTCPPDEQARRLRAREGARYAAFAARWIPLEEMYFAQYHVEQRADVVINTVP